MDSDYEPLERCARALERIADLRERQLVAHVAGQVAAGLASRPDLRCSPWADGQQVAEWIASLVTLSVGAAQLIVQKCDAHDR